MKETDQAVLPQGGTDTCGLGVTFGKTWVWAYEIKNAVTKKLLGPANWPAVTVETRRFVPTVVKYVNQLPTFDPSTPTGPGLVQGLVTVDQSIHWADPLGNTGPTNCQPPLTGACLEPFDDSPPATVHLHGAEVASGSDGGPDSWFTPSGINGPGYSTLDSPGPGSAIYAYPNWQEPGTLWFHDHALGATRTNVYSGLATFYFIRAPFTEPRNLPDGPYEIEAAIQDRQFGTDSQLFWPDGSGADVATSNLNGPPPNPDLHPYWIPEFIGDVTVVNGAPWPYLDVEPRRYRFRLLNGSNARFYDLSFGGVPVYQIGNDDTYLDARVPVTSVLLAPAERADLVVDFTGLAGQNVTVTNDAPVPYPDGLVPGVDQPGMANVMQFQVASTASGTERSGDPAAGGCARPFPIARLTDGNGNIASGVKVDRVRRLALKEVETENGPLEVLVNNTKWNGLVSPNIEASFPTDGVSELPRVGSTELWEIVNLTVDAHPMHTHLVQFQILNREAFDANPGGYIDHWAAAFGNPDSAPLPSGCTAGQFCPAYGPPLPYDNGETTSLPNGQTAVPVVGGNPDPTAYLSGLPTPPAPEELGWKDTARALPGQVLRLLVRWAPTSAPVSWGKAGRNLYPFDPTSGPGYVWHCHIIDHEDNEMMRPYKVVN